VEDTVKSLNREFTTEEDLQELESFIEHGSEEEEEEEEQEDVTLTTAHR
jgi:hypothetical protein